MGLVDATSPFGRSYVDSRGVFWGHSAPHGTPPDVADAAQAEKFLDALYGPENTEEEEEVIELDDSLIEVFVNYQCAMEDERAATAQKKAAANAVKKAMGCYQVASCGGFTATWKPQTRKGYTVEDKTFRALRVKLVDDTINHEED